MLSTIAEIQKGQGLGSGYKWLAGLVSRVCMAGLVFRICMGGSKYHVTGLRVDCPHPGICYTNQVILSSIPLLSDRSPLS